MARLSDFKDRKEFMAYVRSMKNKNNNMNVEKKNKKMKGKGVMSDILSNVKDYAVEKGKEMVKEKGKELLDKGVEMVIKKVRGGKLKKGKGILGDIGKTVFKSALDMAPLPGVVKNIGSNVGELLIDKIGGGINDTKNNMIIGKDKTILVKKNMASKSGGALKVLGKMSGGALKIM